MGFGVKSFICSLIMFELKSTLNVVSFYFVCAAADYCQKSPRNTSSWGFVGKLLQQRREQEQHPVMKQVPADKTGE